MKQLEVHIMQQSYMLGCPEGQEERLMAAVEAVTADRSLHTRDLGGEASTAQVTEAVCRHLQAGEVAARKAA